MDDRLNAEVQAAKDAACAVLRHNAYGPCAGWPRAAGWGYPEPYTRDLMLSTLGVLVAGEASLLAHWRQVLEETAAHQTPSGHIPSYVHTATARGASDTTPLFLLAVGLMRQALGEPAFLKAASARALAWMVAQSPGDEGVVGQLPTSDWRDEQWVLGFGLFVNSAYYAALRLLGEDALAGRVRESFEECPLGTPPNERADCSGVLLLPDVPHYALWAYKIERSERFDLLGNSLAILAGIPSRARACAILTRTEDDCAQLRQQGQLCGELPPVLLPFIYPDDADWRPRYASLNPPGDYHNGGIWPFVCGIHIAALVAAGLQELAEHKLAALTAAVRLHRDPALEFGFNEWLRAQDGTPQGQEWQTWSAALYLYAAACVEAGRPLFFESCQPE